VLAKLNVGLFTGSKIQNLLSDFFFAATLEEKEV